LPRFHRELLAEKVWRSIAGLDVRGAKILVVCAGSGMDAEYLARAGGHVVAVDISAGAAGRVAERSRRFGIEITPVVADAERLPFANDSFDVAYVHDGLHHLGNPFRALDELARVAAHAVSATEPARAILTKLAVKAGVAAEREEAGNEVYRFEADEIAARLRSRGFRIARAERYGMFYRHVPGLPSRLLSLPGVYDAATFGLRGANRLAGRFGNKLVVVGIRE
jgi:ubiquinone/menaquinone biosynthesis C-methylase UbiE